MANFKICPSLFSPKEQIFPNVHIVQCKPRELNPFRILDMFAFGECDEMLARFMWAVEPLDCMKG